LAEADGAHRELPFLFAGSAAASAGGLAMAAAPTAEAALARRPAAAGVVLDLAAERLLQRRLGVLAEPYQQRRPGTFLCAAPALNVADAVGAVAGARSRVVSAVAGSALLSASLLTRFAVFQVGLASAEHSKYTVVPQRDRADARAAPGLTG
jgi:hypothetical protein